MAIILYETLDGNFQFSNTDDSVSDINISEAAVEQNIDPNSLMVDVEAIHAMPHYTRNYTRYTEKCLKNSIPGWTKPYNKPLITHHNEKNGDIIGRVIGASYKTNDTFSKTPALVLTVNIPGEKDKADIKNGINQTVSIGVIADDVRCSICGKPVELDSDGSVISCEHQKGHIYGKETAFWDIHSMQPKEVSYVIVPSDIFAGNVRSYPATKSKPSVSESYEKEGMIESMDIKEMEEKLKTAEEKAVNFETSFKAVSATKDNLEQQVKEAADKNNSLQEQVNKLISEKDDLKKKVELLEADKISLQTKVSDFDISKKDLEEKLSEEQKMREELETELASVKISLKESLIDNLQVLRSVGGKVALDESLLRNREESSIRDSIADLKLELKEKTNEAPKTPGTVENPGLVEEAKDSTSISLKEQKGDGGISDLRAGLETIFMAVAGSRK